MIPDFALVRPRTVDDALEAMAHGGVPYCGGTELLAAMQLGMLAPDVLVDLKRLDALSGIALDGDRLVVGATTRHVDIASSDLVSSDAPILATACRALGNQRVRATGSIAGNLCFAEPRSDVAAALTALDAEVVLLSSARGERAVAVAEFLEGALTTVREDDELLVRVHVPRATGPQVYLRFQPAEYPTVSVAAVVRPSRPDPVGIVVGAVGERPYVTWVASPGAVDADAVASQADVIEDLGGAEDYKRHLVGVFVRRAVAELTRRLAGGGRDA
ncbi:MAG: FAD binding domain-containing protein [Streptosporangiales bacterium]|nr:FAD binding domain-containing protein [Streptosporangiales bacterium]MBO0889296.1 FAD binding domain-containing protein [Acidothermales bacterium]